MIIYYSPPFQRNYKRLERRIKRAAMEKRIELFRRDPFHPKLHTHALGGSLKNMWSFSVDFHNRILFEFLDKRHEEVLFLDIGDHSLYQ
jgi:mRNA-degrading endonuclease YafQ of YafQ-DinJ toxin-antitoxin module